MGIVYVAEDTRLNRKVALKLLPPIVALDPQARADTGHNIPRPGLIRESLEWLDKYLGRPPE